MLPDRGDGAEPVGGLGHHLDACRLDKAGAFQCGAQAGPDNRVIVRYNGLETGL
ncbi:hypothetical protein GCM10011319_42820 [Mameliella alba]|nr:hypothetical protein GCM10011319_42820 [Mameliella alba]